MMNIVTVIWQTHIEQEGNLLVDYAYYEPSEAPAIFVASPILQNEQTLGVVTLKISDEVINVIMNERTGIGEIEETYLVGEDNLMCSNSRFFEQATILDRIFSLNLRVYRRN